MLVRTCTNWLFIWRLRCTLRVHFDFTEYCKAEDCSLSAGFRGGKTFHKLQNAVTNLYCIVLHSCMITHDVNRPFPIPQTGLTWLRLFRHLDERVLSIPLSHTPRLGSLCSGTFSTSLITNCSKVLLFCNSTAFVGKSQLLLEGEGRTIVICQMSSLEAYYKG